MSSVVLGNNNITIDGKIMEIGNSIGLTPKIGANPIVKSIERMYPPIRNVSSENHQITGQHYGNGLYVTSFSSFISPDQPWNCFNTSNTVGGHWGSDNRYIVPNGNFSSTLTDNIVPGYNGDWLKIKFPVAINLTRYAFKIRPSTGQRAPQNFKIYGSNDETNWVEITYGTNPIYVNGLFDTTISTSGTYNSFGLVVNKMIGDGSGSADALNFDEWFIYGTEILNKSIAKEEKMYPPIRNVVSSNHLVQNQAYGNGNYVISFSTFWSVAPPFQLFKNGNYGTFGFHHYLGGVYRDTENDNIVDGYNGDWVKIKLPVSIKLTRIVIKARSVLDRAPEDFKIYGSNDEINWVEIIHITDATYSAENTFYELLLSIPEYYNNYGLVVNKLFDNVEGVSGVLNFDEWFIYGIDILNDYGYIPFTYDPNVENSPVLQVDSTNLMAHYKFNGNLLDSSGNNRTLSQTGAITYNTSSQNSFPYSQYIDTTATAQTNFTTTPDINQNVPISFAFWFFVSGTGTYTMMGYGDYSLSSPSIQFDFNGGNQLTVHAALSNRWTTSPTVSGLSINTWYHCVYTLNNTASVQVILYLNGVSRATGTGNANQTLGTSKHLVIGESGDKDRGFLGRIGDVRIYNKVLTPSEVLELYNLKEQSSYSITFPENTECDILIVGGGGGGGGGHGGGGGAGQLVLIHNAILNGNYNIIVGRGGIRGTNPASGGVEPTKGIDTSFDTVIAEGGGATGKGILKNGGSGSGGDGWLGPPNLGDRDKGIKNATVDTYTTGTVYSKGNDGGTGGRGQNGSTASTSDAGQGGGGGGAGTVGGNGADWNVNASPGNGGDGLSGISEIGYDFKTMFGTNFGKVETDNLIYFAGGGGGGGWDIVLPETNSTGGKGGGGAGGIGTAISNGLNAKDNTGSGGGGGSASYGEGGNGGSGIVIIRYKIIKTNFDAQWTYSSTNPNVYHMGNVGIGTTNPTSALSVIGSIDIDGPISALYKTFKIEHPLNINKWLYHGCVEGPRFDNIYRGKKMTIDGKCEIDIDKECNTVGGMSEGTFDALNTSCQLYVMNNQTYDRVNGKIDSGKITINCENITDNIEIDWLVIGERKDEQITNVPYTNDVGKLICEHNI